MIQLCLEYGSNNIVLTHIGTHLSITVFQWRVQEFINGGPKGFFLSFQYFKRGGGGPAQKIAEKNCIICLFRKHSPYKSLQI